MLRQEDGYLLLADEPIYQGKRLSEWLKPNKVDSPVVALGHSAFELEQLLKTDTVIRQIGTNAIPTLLRILRAKDSALKVQLMGFVQRQHIIEVDSRPAKDWNRAAAMAFQPLGTDAQSAVPELIEIANQNISPYSRTCAIESLGFIGPAAEEAVPSLLRWATTSDARRALLRIDPEAAAKAGVR